MDGFTKIRYISQEIYRIFLFAFCGLLDFADHFTNFILI